MTQNQSSNRLFCHIITGEERKPGFESKAKKFGWVYNFIMMFAMIAFDADDTLWHNETRYSQAKEDFASLLAKYHPVEESKAFLDKVEVRNIPMYGYGLKSFTLSMVEAAIELSEGAISGNELRPILNLARQVLSTDIELFAHVQDIIQRLTQSYPLMLITKGDASEQESKVQRSGLLPYFQAIEIVNDKTIPVYQTILEKYRLSPSSFVMVGNSLRSDIYPVVHLGGTAIYIPQSSTWFHENLQDEVLDRGDYYQLEHIGLLPDLLAEIDKRV